MEKMPKRVLQVLGKLDMGGAESRVMDIYRNINKEIIQFDFMVHDENEGFFEKEIKSLGGNIYRVPRFKIYNILGYKKAWEHFFRLHNEFIAVHGHMTSTAAIYLPIAKSAGVPMTIAHARSAGVDKGLKGIVTKFIRRNLCKKTDFCLACSALAGEAVYGHRAVEKGRVVVIPNGITAEKYCFQPRVRKEIREKLSISENFVVGHVGRFHYAKNHEYLIRIFAEICKNIDNAKLLLVGEGPLQEEVRRQVLELGLKDKVIFAGMQTNISDFYQCMDYLVFPSRFEGLPGTVVEAQVSGLKCLISDTIAPEVVLTKLVKTESILKSPKVWADIIRAEKDYSRESQYIKIIEAGFDVMSQIENLQESYLGRGF